MPKYVIVMKDNRDIIGGQFNASSDNEAWHEAYKAGQTDDTVYVFEVKNVYREAHSKFWVDRIPPK